MSPLGDGVRLLSEVACDVPHPAMSVRYLVCGTLLAVGSGLVTSCAHRLTSDDKFRDKHFEATPSMVTLPAGEQVKGTTYEAFVAKWLTRLPRAKPDLGAFAAHQATVMPPPTLGYDDVGSRETDELLYFFREWCRQNGGSPAADSGDDMDKGQLLDRKLDTSKRALSWRPTVYCRAGAGGFSAAIVFRYTMKHQATEPAELEVHHYSAGSVEAARAEVKSQNALAQARAEEQERAQKAEHAAAEADQQRRLLETAASFRTNLRVGSDTHCGLVIEIRPPLAQVQASVGPYWLKIAQIFPPNTVGCRFSDGRYLDP